MVIAGVSPSLLALSGSRQRNLTTVCREVSKVTAAGESAVRLLVPPDQETGVSRIDGHQVSVRIAGSVVPFAGTTREFVVLVADDGRCIAEVSGD
jgi:hypothetical protein